MYKLMGAATIPIATQIHLVMVLTAQPFEFKFPDGKTQNS